MKNKKIVQLILPLVIQLCFTNVFSQGSSLNPELTINEILLNNIPNPWGLDFMNSDELLYTEKSGKLKKYKISTKSTNEITGLPAIVLKGQGGLLDIALHPNFATNKLVYLSYSIAASGGQTTAIGRGTLNENQLTNFTELFRALPVVNSDQHFGSRIAFDTENFLYFSVGDRGTPANSQNTNIHLGKVMRLNDDGTVPADNPLVGIANTKPEIYSWGHRNIQGLALNHANGKIYAHEHGPKGGDELNLIQKGKNYGWPTVTFGIDYNGSIISSDTALPGLEPPLTYWVPSIAPSGLVFVKNDQATNEADVLIGALAGTHLHWVRMINDKKVLATKSLQGYARFRDVAQAPDGSLYALTETPNRLVRLSLNIALKTNNTLDQLLTKEEKIFPNPSKEQATLRIVLEKSQNVTLRVYISNSTLIAEKNFNKLSAGENLVEMPMTNISAGFYWVEIKTESRKSVVKWVVN